MLQLHLGHPFDNHYPVFCIFVKVPLVELTVTHMFALVLYMYLYNSIIYNIICRYQLVVEPLLLLKTHLSLLLLVQSLSQLALPQ